MMRTAKTKDTAAYNITQNPDTTPSTVSSYSASPVAKRTDYSLKSSTTNVRGSVRAENRAWTTRAGAQDSSPSLTSATGRMASTKRRVLSVACNETEPISNYAAGRSTSRVGKEDYELGVPVSLLVSFIYEFDTERSFQSGYTMKPSSNHDTEKNGSEEPDMEFRADVLQNSSVIRSVAEHVTVNKKFSTCADRQIVKCRFQLKGWSPSLRGEGWLGFILKRTAAGRSSPLSKAEVTIGVPLELNDLALTGRQWAYAVAARQGQLHVCAINIGLAFWFANTIIDKRWKEIRSRTLKGKKTELVFDFGYENLTKWVCRGTHFPLTSPSMMSTSPKAAESSETMGDSQSTLYTTRRGTDKFINSSGSSSIYPSPSSSVKFSVRSMREEPLTGYIRQDLSYSISAFRSIFSEATGLKAGFVSIPKFTKGYCRSIKQKAEKAQLTQPVVQVYNEVCVLSTIAEFREKLRLQAPNGTSPSSNVNYEEGEQVGTYRSMIGAQDEAGGRSLKRGSGLPSGAGNYIKVYLNDAKKRPGISDQHMAICSLSEVIQGVD